MQTAIVIGAGGGIGNAICNRLIAHGEYKLIAVSRKSSQLTGGDYTWFKTDYSERSIAACSREIQALSPDVARLILCNGILHDGDIQPEKKLEQLRLDNALRLMQINSLVPMLWLSSLLPVIPRKQKCVIAAFSARIGSIDDNRSGGWYSYRASKAALNMLMRSASIEMARRYPMSKLMVFHPGTTDTGLSRPFQANVPAEDLLQPDYVADCLLDIMAKTDIDGQLSYLDWENKAIRW